VNDPIAPLLAKVRTVAVVGWSPDPFRPSAHITAYLERAGFEVYRVNPRAEEAYARLADLPVKIDLVVIFRRSEEAAAHVQEAAEIGAGAVWLQEGVTTVDGGTAARAAGLGYVEDRCVMVEHRMLRA
jgi:predicted CoA-binding protein